MWSYKFRHWFFRWIVDVDGDVGLTLCGGLVTFVKYKEHTIVYWWKKFSDEAGKHQGRAGEIYEKT